MNAIPRLNFAQLPTAIEPMPRLSAALKGPNLLVKRDDQTGLAFGGNKTRKLEFLLADAQANGAHTLITAGAMQSNHCRQTAAAAARHGFDCILVLYSVTGPTAAEKPSANLFLDYLLGAEIVQTTRPQRDQTLNEVFETAEKAGRRPYLIPYGGSNPLGALGYVFAMQEFLSHQVPADWIVFPSSSGGTHAGLALGAKLFGYKGKVLGISVDEPEKALKERVAQLAEKTADLLGEKISIHPDDILANADYLGAGYGMMGPGEQEAIRLFARYEALLLDPVYTGRAAQGLIDLIQKGTFTTDETVLFWHTGGTPALFADPYQARLV